jgi:heparanase 1
MSTACCGILLLFTTTVAMVLPSLATAQSYCVDTTGTPAATGARTPYLQTTMDIAVLVNGDSCDLGSPRLVRMARTLGFQHMRVGGTEGDYALYNLTDASAAPPLSPPPSPFLKVLTKGMWDGVNGFAEAIGVTIFFGINAGYGAGVRGQGRKPWEPTMARELMLYSQARGFPLAGFEFSNEPNLFFGRMNATDVLTGADLARDIVTFRTLVKSLNASWRVICCDVAYVPVFGEINGFARDFSMSGGAAYVDDFTFHFYPLLAASYNKVIPSWLDPFSALPTRVLQPLILDQVGYWADRFYAAVNADANSSDPRVPSSRVWLGETGSAVGGGQDGLSDRFADCIEYVDKIGQMRVRGQAHMYRQTLCGSPDQYYALISHDLQPRPSYFATLLVNTLYGSTTLTVATVSNATSAALLRVYAVCGRNGEGNSSSSSVVVTVINLDQSSSSANVRINLTTTVNASAALYVLEPAPKGNLTAPTVTVNDVDMEVSQGGSLASKIVPTWVSVGPEAAEGVVAFDVPALSITFLEAWPAAESSGFAACHLSSST